MLELLFCVCMVMIFGKLLVFALQASWGLLQILLTVVFLPIALLLMLVSGLLAIAIPVLAIVGILALVGCRN